ncbi:hypothetical protein IMZ48_07540 [Candidatus Bathyarchaeota archaeon]|nr:hypothetical protein [Candidatus Bathyarchaeota archaeon]
MPDTLAFGGGFKLVRFKKERDLVRIALDDSKGRARDAPGFRLIPGFSESVVNLCVSDNNILSTKWLKFYCCLPNLKFLYDQIVAYESRDLEQLPWCQSDFVHRVVDHGDDETCCWPDILRHRDYARRHVKTDRFPVGVDVMSWAQWRAKKNDNPARCPCSLTEQNLDHLGNIKLWPLVWSTDLDVDGTLS